MLIKLFFLVFLLLYLTCSRWRQHCTSKWIRKGPWAYSLSELWSCSQYAGVWKIWQVLWGNNQSDSVILQLNTTISLVIVLIHFATQYLFLQTPQLQ